MYSFTPLSVDFPKELVFLEELGLCNLSVDIRGSWGGGSRQTRGVGGVSKGGALANTNCASWGVLFQTLKTLGFFGTCQEIYFSSWEEA